jgi:type II secretory pathway pseudopilin PulG
MEPERNIEKWLRAFARKRRAGADDDFKLHPARRRQLQDEVARQFAEEPEAEESVSLWQLFRQQWAFLLMFVLILFFGASFLMPALSSAKQKAKRYEAVSHLKQIGLAAQIAAEDNHGRLPAALDALTNVVSGKTLLDPVSGKPFVYVAAGETLGNLQSNSVLAYSPEDKNGRALLFADGSVEVVNGQKFDEFQQRGFIQPAVPMELAANAPAPAALALVESKTFGGMGRGGGGGVATASFGLESVPAKSASEITVASAARTWANGEAAALGGQQSLYFKAEQASKPGPDGAVTRDLSYRQLGVTSTPFPVLASFEFRPASNAVLVVDADGSVYQGNWQPEIATAAPAIMPPLEKTKTAKADQSEMLGALSGGQTFRVAGQNRTTKQSVVFTGTLTPLAATNAGPTNLFYPARLTGTVTLDETNRVEIRAVPATP